MASPTPPFVPLSFAPFTQQMRLHGVNTYEDRFQVRIRVLEVANLFVPDAGSIYPYVKLVYVDRGGQRFERWVVGR